MIEIILLGFVLGFLIPVTAGRFGKVLPADPGMVLLKLWHSPHFPRTNDVYRTRLLRKKWIKLWLYSVFWGSIMAILFGLTPVLLKPSIHLSAYFFFVIIGFCIVVDIKYFLLPDFFTIPLLLFGFYASLSSDVLLPDNSIFGAFFGYLIAVIAVLLTGFVKQSELGSGDVKMMTALGAWLGISGLNYTLLLSFFFFSIPAFFYEQKRGAYGPALGIAGLITFFIIYAK